MIHFKFKKDLLIAYNTNKEKSDKKDEETSGTDPDRWVLEIPIKHVDYASRKKGNDSNAGLEEVEKVKGITWKSSLYIQLTLSKVKWPLTYRMFKGGYSVKDLTVSSDYFSFLIEDENTNQTIRFSFLKRTGRESSYEPLYSTTAVENLFPPYYASPRLRVEDRQLETEDFQRRPVARFNIKKPIRYHFSDMTPESVRVLGKESINIWNQIFQKAEVPCPERGCFEWVKKDVPLGDIRYNVFHFTDPRESLDSFNMGGFGPKLLDYETGEVVSATTSVGTWMFHKVAVSRIKKYIQREVGFAVPFLEKGIRHNFQLSNSQGQAFLLRPDEGLWIPKGLLDRLKFFGSSVFPDIPLGASGKDYTKVYGFQRKGDLPFPITMSSYREALGKSERERLLVSYNLATETDNENLPKDLSHVYQVIRKFFGEANYRACDMQERMASMELMGDRIYDLIGALCKDQLSPMQWLLQKDVKSPHLQIERWRDGMKIGTGKGQEKGHWEREITECANKILPFYALEVTLHEQGHNVSMKHNFAGSADEGNVLQNTDFQHKFVFSHVTDQEKDRVMALLSPYSSTVMDYNADPSLSPGAYDVAFSRFYYAGKIEGIGGDIQEVDFDSLSDSDRHSFKFYRVCEDSKGRQILGNDIFCSIFDRGSSATEIVNNYYNQFIHLPSAVSLNQLQPRGGLWIRSFIFKVRKIYHKWREQLAAKRIDTADPYHLKGTDEETYTEKIHRLIMTEKCRSIPPNKDKAACLCEIDSLNSEESDKSLRDLYCAKRKIADTFKEILFQMEDHYCLVRNDAKQSELIAFRDMHAELTKRSDFSIKISSCHDIPKEEFEAAGWRLEGEVGYPLYSGNFSTYINHSNRWDENVPDNYYSGLLYERVMAAIGFLIRTPLIIPNQRALYTTAGVGLLDEPDIRHSVQESLRGRITEGVSKFHFFSKKFYDACQNNDTSRLNSEEKGLLRWNFQVLDMTPQDCNPLYREAAVGGKSRYYKFSNEAFLWQIVTFPLLSFVKPPTDYFNRLRNITFNLAQVRILPSFWYDLASSSKFYLSLKLKNEKDAYIFSAVSDPESSSQSSPFLVFPSVPFKEDKRAFSMEDILKSLEKTDQALSLNDFEKDFKDFIEYKKSKDPNNSANSNQEPLNLNDFVESRKKVIQEDIIRPVSQLFDMGENSSEIPSQMLFLLVYSVLFDYLLDGQRLKKKTDMISAHTGRYYLTDHLVEVLQTGLIMKYKIQKDFDEKCKEKKLPTCPHFDLHVSDSVTLNKHLGSENAEFRQLLEKAMNTKFPFFRVSDYVTDTGEDSDTIKTVNLFRPFFNHLRKEYEEAESNSDFEISEIFVDSDLRQLLFTLLMLQSFKPGELNKPVIRGTDLPCGFERKYIRSEISHQLLRMLFKVSNHQTPESCTRIIDGIQFQMQWARANLKDMQDTLIHFTDSRLLREIFFVSLFDHFSKEVVLLLIQNWVALGYRAQSLHFSLSKIASLRDIYFKGKELVAAQKLFENMPNTISEHYNALSRFMQIMESVDTSGINGLIVDAFDRITKPSAEASSDYRPVFKGIFNKLFEGAKKVGESSGFSNRINKDIMVQRNILINSSIPNLQFDPSSGVGGGESSASAAAAFKPLSSEDVPDTFATFENMSADTLTATEVTKIQETIKCCLKKETKNAEDL